MRRIDHLLLCARTAQAVRDAPPGHAAELQRRLRWTVNANLSTRPHYHPPRRLMPDGGTVPARPGLCPAIAAWLALVQSSEPWGITRPGSDRAATGAIVEKK